MLQRSESADSYISIEAKTMTYFQEPVTAIYLRDVSKVVFNHELKKKKDKAKMQMETMRYSNENVAHEMRAPLGSIIVIINLLLSMIGKRETTVSVREPKVVRKYYKQVKF